MSSAYNLDPDQARKFVPPDLDPICLTLRWYSWTILEKGDFKKKTADDKAWKISQEAELALKAPIKTAADYKFCDIFPNFRQK